MSSVETKKGKMKKASRTQRMMAAHQDAIDDRSANYADRLPRAAGKPPSQLEYVRDIHETPNDLFTASGVLGERSFDRSVYDATKQWQKQELGLIRKNFIESQVWDLADPYQKEMAMRAAPSIISSRRSQIDAATEQFKWISQMTLQQAFQSEAEVNRMIDILGGAEPLISLNHYFGAVADANRAELQSLFNPSADGGLYAVGDVRNKWMQGAGGVGDFRFIRRILRQLTAQVLHLFPVQYGKLKYNPRGELGRSARPYANPGLQLGRADVVANALQAQCYQACAVMNYGGFMRQMHEQNYGGQAQNEENQPGSGYGPQEQDLGERNIFRRF